MPNILNHNCQVDGGLSDAGIRSIAANVSCIFGAGGLYGTTQTEKISQWYLIYAVAADDDTDFELKAMPIMRVKSQTGQAIKTGTLTTPATGIDYGFTDDDLLAGKLYFLTGDSKGLMRAISANDVDTDTRITYTGAALTVAAGDWFVVLPPTNFRLVGTIFNDSSGNIVQFRRLGNIVQWVVGTAPALNRAYDAVVEDIRMACPLAVAAQANIQSNSDSYARIGHPSLVMSSSGYDDRFSIHHSDLEERYATQDFTLEFCRYYIYATNCYGVSYSYPPGCGY
jgi:hypothetical protein